MGTVYTNKGKGDGWLGDHNKFDNFRGLSPFVHQFFFWRECIPKNFVRIQNLTNNCAYMYDIHEAKARHKSSKNLWQKKEVGYKLNTYVRQESRSSRGQMPIHTIAQCCRTANLWYLRKYFLEILMIFLAILSL